MIITNFDSWVGYQFGNKLLGLNNLIQISNYYKQDYWFNDFAGLDIFNIEKKTKEYVNQPYELIDTNILLNKKDSLIFDNNNVYYLQPCLFEFFHQFNEISTFDIFKFSEPFEKKNKMVAVHFRGTDFHVWDKNAILPFEYYKKSIDYVIEEINDTFVFILFTDDLNLDSFKKTIDYLKNLNIPFEFGSSNDFKADFKKIAYCDYVISTPSTFCITASLCGFRNKKIIHSKQWVIDYKKNSKYFRDVFWQNLLDKRKTNDYVIHTLI